tara:strand:- start:2186 stop:3061 length:876 start_codon:yes stop_codon:yes gene_type:complete
MSNAKYDRVYRPVLEKLPDPQQTHSVEGADVPIQKVGINEFELPITIWPLNENTDARISAYVDLRPGSKGINMSRLVRQAVAHCGGNGRLQASPEVLTSLLGAYLDTCDANTAYIKLRFKVPLRQESLRSGLVGSQYYKCEVEAKLSKGQEKIDLFTTVRFIYSSACPCSYELAKQATSERGAPAISHSQRSEAKVTVKSDSVRIGEIVQALRDSLVTETQVMVKREDEQAFAELNGSHPKFVEDAARLVWQGLNGKAWVEDFCASCEHWESLHSHNAVSVIYKGVPGGLR